MVAAIYCPLSKEDEDRRQESESIQNQRSMLIQYAVDHAWDIYDIYTDDDYSGTDRDRPAFNRMLEDAEKHKFDLVLVKTQSRFTRDMEMVEKYIHGKFVEWGIRFVSMVDNADTEVKSNKKARQINGLINEWYLEDLSESVKSVLDNKRQNGKFIGSFCCYGYQKAPDDHNRLVVDEEAAAVVQKIYALALQGNGKTHISKLLNEEGIPNPSAYKRQKGLNFNNGRDRYQHGMWCPGTVGQILKDPVYTGVLIQGKNKKVSYKSKKMVRCPESEWYISPNNHPAIIPQATYDLVQQMIATRPRAASSSGMVYPLSGVVYCAECGSVLHRCRGNVLRDGRSASYLRCKLHTLKTGQCANHAIRLDHLTDEVHRRLQEHIRVYFEPEKADMACIEAERAKRAEQLLREQKQAKAEMEQYQTALSNLYLDKIKGILSEEQFLDLNHTLLAQKKQTETRLRSLTQKLEQATEAPKDLDTRRQRLLRLAEMPDLNRELVTEFIRRVEVSDADPEQLAKNRNAALRERKIMIEWKF